MPIPRTTTLDKWAAQCKADRLVAEAAILYTDANAIDWPEAFMAGQVQLIVDGTCDSRAHDSTCVAHERYQSICSTPKAADAERSQRVHVLVNQRDAAIAAKEKAERERDAAENERAGWQRLCCGWQGTKYP